MKAYQHTRISTASPGQIVVLLYEGLVRFTVAARRALADEAFAEAGVAIERALDIIAHLGGTLRHDVAPEMAAQLERTYEAWTACLLRAQRQKDCTTLDAIVAQMNELLDGWRRAVPVSEAAERGETP
jgi:flagellar protein FliS